MARKKSGNKPKEIRDATIGEVAAVGSTAVSVNKIAERAGLSVGTLYRYHATKDDLLFWVYLETKRDIHNAMMAAAAAHDDPAGRLRAMWFALVAYGVSAPKEFLFAEMMSAEAREAFRQNSELNAMQQEIQGEIEEAITQDVLLPASVSTIEVALAAPAMALARRASMSGHGIEAAAQEELFDLVWRGIAKERTRPGSLGPG